MKIIYKIETEFPPPLLLAAAGLYRVARWVDENDDCAFLKAALENSCAVCVAYCDDKVCGMGRALGDHVSDAYIQDVVVAPEFRRHGIGGGIVKNLAAELRRQGVEWIGLVGAPGTENFYRALGLTAPGGYTFYQVE